MKNIEHIGIAVKSLDQSNPVFERLLNTPCYKTEEVPSEGVKTSFFKTGESKIELLEATADDSPIARFLDKRGEGMHHIAFLVEDIHAELDRLSREGFQVIGDGPKPGADNKLVAFLHPKSAGGVLIEICQEVEKLEGV